MDEYNKYKNSQNHKKHNKRNKLSFYVSLAICITAVGLAVWSTFTSYSSFKDKQDQVTTATATQANNQVTGVTVEETTTTTSAIETTTVSTTVSETTIPNTSTTMSAVQTMLQVPGNLIYPVENGKILKSYSEEAVYNKTMGDYRSHLGLDFQCNKKTEVLSMSDGVVSDVYTDERMGKVLVMDCGSFMIYYSGLDNIKVNINDSVSKGDVISNVGDMPCENKDGIHLHVAIRVNGSYVDPLSVIGTNE